MWQISAPKRQTVGRATGNALVGRRAQSTVFSVVAAIVISLTPSSSTVQALPSGAPSCIVGRANPSDVHLDPARNPQTGPISTADFVLYIDNELVPFGSTNSSTLFIGNFTTGVAHTVHVSSTAGTQFKGVLLLLSQSDGIDARNWLRPQSPLQIAPGCVNTVVAGCTHRSNTLKSSALATLQVHRPVSNLKLDVNLVLVNDIDGGSVYYHSQYQLQAVGDIVPTRAPTISPTRAPVQATPTSSSRPLRCGILGAALWCPLTRCGIVGRLLNWCQNS